MEFLWNTYGTSRTQLARNTRATPEQHPSFAPYTHLERSHGVRLKGGYNTAQGQRPGNTGRNTPKP